jgi:hypothetical protein
MYQDNFFNELIIDKDRKRHGNKAGRHNEGHIHISIREIFVNTA